MLTKEAIEAAKIHVAFMGHEADCPHCRALFAALAAYERVAELVDELECTYGDDCPDFGTRHGRCLPCKLRRALNGG